MPRSIEAAVFTPESGPHCEIQEVELADPGPGELIIRVRACGICHTDIGTADFLPRPSVLGHEAAGDVVEVGDSVTAFAPGDRVVATFSSCGTCPACQTDAPAYCLTHIPRNFNGLRPNGETSFPNSDPAIFGAFFQQSSFADHALVQTDNVVKIPDDLSFELAAPLGCGIQTGAGAVLNSLNVPAGQSIVIFGVGAVGLSAVMAAKARGCNPIIAVDLNADRLDLAKELGATHGIMGDDADLVEKVKTWTEGGADFSLEGSGAPISYQNAINCLRPKGTCGTLAYPGNFGEPVEHPGGFAFMDTRTMGIVEGDSIPTEFIPELIDMYRAGDLPYDRLITTFAFHDINKALDAMHQQRVIKPVLVFDEG